MSVKVSGKSLHLTTFEVSTSGRNIRACLEAQKNFAKANLAIKNFKEDDDESLIKSLEAQENLIDEEVAFLKKTLKLSDAQVDKIWDADFDKVNDFTTEVIEAVMRVDKSKSEDAK